MQEEYIKKNIESEIRNPTISKVLFLNKSIEKFGSGFKRIDSLCKDSGISYSYVNDSNGFKFVLNRNAITADATVETTTYTAIKKLNDTEKTILELLKYKPNSSREELAEKTSKTVRTIQRALNTLKDQGLIEREGAKQNSVWKVKKN